MESRTLFAVKRQSPNAHLKVLRNPGARIEDKLEFLAPALHNSSQTYIEFLQRKLDAHVKHQEAEKLATQRLQRGQELNWPQRAQEDLQFGNTLQDYARDYLVLPRDTFFNMDKALLRKKETEDVFEWSVAEKMQSQGWIMNPCKEWDLIQKKLEEEAEEEALEQDKAMTTAMREGEAKGKTVASENVFYATVEDCDDKDEDEDDSDDFDHIYSHADPPAKGTTTPEAPIDNNDQKSVNPLTANTTTAFIVGLPTPPSSPPSEPEVDVDTSNDTQLAAIQRPPTPPIDSPVQKLEQASSVLNWADDAIEAAENGECVCEEGNYDPDMYEKEEFGDSQSSKGECYDADSDSDSDSDSEEDIQNGYPLQRFKSLSRRKVCWVEPELETIIEEDVEYLEEDIFDSDSDSDSDSSFDDDIEFGYPLKRFKTLAGRKVCWVEPELETIYEEDEDEGYSEEDIFGSDSDSDYESKDEESITNYQAKRRASDPEEYAKMTREEFHIFLDLENQERAEFSLPSINQYFSPLLRETFALDYDQRSQSETTDDVNPPASLTFEAAPTSSTTSEAAPTPTPAQRHKAAFLSSLYQAKKEAREEMETQETEESALRREESQQRHRVTHDLKIAMTLISLRLRMDTQDNLVQDPTNRCLFKRNPSSADSKGPEEVMFVGEDLVTAIEVDEVMGIIDDAVKVLKEEGVWMKYEKKDCMEHVRASVSKATLLPEVSRLWEEKRWQQARSFVRKAKEKMDKNEAAQMEVIGELFVRFTSKE